MKKFQVKVANKNDKKDSRTYNPVVDNKGQAYDWGVKQAVELYGSEGKVEVLGEIED